MAAKSKDIRIPAPTRGLATRDRKSSRMDQGLALVNMLAGKRNEIERRPGYEHYTYGFDFAGLSHFGLQKYIDESNNERLIAVNNGQIQEFTYGATANRAATNPNRYHAFSVGNGAVFAVDGLGKHLKGFGASWRPFGVRGPDTEPVLTQGTGGSLADGTYLVGISYALKSGASRLIITASEYGTSSITIASGSNTATIVLTRIPPAPAPYTHMIIWCTAVNGSTLYLDQEIVAASITATIDTAPTSGIDLGSYENNYGIQSNVRWINFADDALWVIEEGTPTQIKRSNQGTHYDNESFPLGNAKQFPTKGLPLTFCFSLGTNEYVMTAHGTYRLPSFDLNATPEIVTDEIGTEHPWSWAPFEDGIIGRTNRGIEYFNGFRFYKMSDDVYELVLSDLFKNEAQGGLGHGVVYDDPKFGPMYMLGVQLPADVVGGVGGIPGYLPGSGSGGTGLGTPSDDFSDNSRNTSRWAVTAGNATITEAIARLNFSKTDQSVEDVYWETICSVNQSIQANIKAAITSHTGSAHDVTQYIKLYLNASNYVELGYRDVNGVLSLRARVAKAGAITTTDIATPPASTTFQIRLYHGRVEMLYKDVAGAWTFILADTYAWTQTGWKVRLGIRGDSATSDPTFTGWFDTLRVQFASGTGLESVIPESFYNETANSTLVCMLRGWIPGSRDGENNEIQPPWFLSTMRAQCFEKTGKNELLHADNTTGKIYRTSHLLNNDDMEMIPLVYQTHAFDAKSGSTIKYSTRADITGSWGQPFKAKLIAYPSKANHEKVVHGYGTGTGFATNPYSSFKFANTESISKAVKFRKMIGTAIGYLITKMDYDASFQIESIEPALQIERGKK